MKRKALNMKHDGQIRDTRTFMNSLVNENGIPGTVPEDDYLDKLAEKVSKSMKEGTAGGTAADAEHYQQAEVEPIEIMQMYFTSEMMHGFCLGNVIKYALRARFKGAEMKDIEKMAQYAKWDLMVMRAERINPRE